MAGKAESQQMFFKIVEISLDSNKQVIFSGNKPLGDLQVLNDLNEPYVKKILSNCGLSVKLSNNIG